MLFRALQQVPAQSGSPLRTRQKLKTRLRPVPAGGAGRERPQGVSGLPVAPRFHGVTASSGAALDMLPDSDTNFLPAFLPTRVIQPYPVSSSLSDLA